MNDDFEKIDDYETIINYLYNNQCGWDNKYAVYRKNAVFSNHYEIVDISTMSACELIDMLARKPLYIKEQDNEI